MQQAGATFERLASLVEASKQGNMAARLALAHLVSFGLRLCQARGQRRLDRDARILQAILRGQILPVPAKSGLLLVSTEEALRDAELRKQVGWWVRLAPESWPGLTESHVLRDVIRPQIASLFSDVLGDEEGGMPARAPQGEPAGGRDRTGVETDGDLEGAKQEGEPAPEPSGRGTEPRTPVSSELQRIIVGSSTSEPVYYDPKNRRSPLENMNMMITGSSGKGKTQLVKSLACALREQDRRVLLLDFKNDYASDGAFCRRARLDRQFVAFDGLPYNPLIPAPTRHPATGAPVLLCSQHIAGIASVLRTAYGLGIQQEAKFKEAIRRCFQERGIDPAGRIPYSESLGFPDFNEVGDRLRVENPLAYNRLDPLFDLGIFRNEDRTKRFDELLTRSLVVDLSAIQSDAIKRTLAQIIVLSAHSYYNAREHSSGARQFFVFDEAHRVLESEFLLRFVRECRAYGVGVILSSQFPAEFGAEVSASLGTKIVHGNDRDEGRVREIVRLLGYQGSEEDIANLGMFEATVLNRQHRNVLVQTLPYAAYVILNFVRENEGATLADLEAVDGLEPTKLDPQFLVNHLRGMGLLVEKNGVLQYSGPQD
jgi:DNA phosphorothioation-dependent restriction protein DptH